MKNWTGFILGVTGFIIIGCSDNPPAETPPAASSVASITHSIVATLPHDTANFTEGLEFYNNSLLESTGLNGKSKLILSDLETGRVIKEVSLDPKFFGEGITVFRDTIYQLTYQENTVLVYDARTLNKIRELPYNNGQGWGMTNDGNSLIVSNGSSNLYFFEPGTFRLLSVKGITENGSAVPNINELEYINGYVYANQWQYNYIIKIDPKSGEVVGKMDLSALVNQVESKDPKAEYLNGIAFNKATNKIYVTGKNWPSLHEIQFEH